MECQDIDYSYRNFEKIAFCSSHTDWCPINAKRDFQLSLDIRSSEDIEILELMYVASQKETGRSLYLYSVCDEVSLMVFQIVEL